ncbi:MAG: UDP-N-acetylmuramoyl-tripeptide--D-alanyl-D-alanine ligase [Ruminococcaceae bacterium]|nr:UDP-N-acetylmuramoyl-tripeptide--D-alanyl-D-alanine ligase [Oscillospiraceae bacterium]
MKALDLKTVAEWCGGTLEGDAGILIDNVSIDSRQINGTTLFFAIVGERFDAHGFIPDVEKNGAAAVVCHKKVECGIPVIYVEDTKKAFLELAKNYRKSLPVTVIGLTGSVGKTTTKEMTYAVVSKKFNAIKTQGNLNNEIGLPRTLFTLDETHNAAVIEMGMSAFGEISALTKTALPDIGIITNIGVSHIEHLGSRDGILKAKLEILDGMKKGSPLILNIDNDKLSEVKRDDYRIVGFGIDSKNADVRAENIEEKESETRFDVLFDGKKQSVTIPTVGIHNVYDALAAFTAGLELGIEPTLIAEALSEYEPSGMRQRIKKINGITVIEDCYNASPDSQRAAINALKSVSAERTIAVLGDMLELGDYSDTAHREIGIYAADKKVDLLFTYGTEAQKICSEAADRGVKAKAFTDKAELFNSLKETLKKGDAVLFKASRGMKLEEVIEMLYKEWNNK